MSNVIGPGQQRVIVDADGEAATVTDGKLDVNAALTVEGDIQIGAVEIKDAASAQRATVNSGGELLVTAPPATFDTVVTSQITLDDDNNWDTFGSVPAQEVMITSPSSNVDTIEISKDGAETAGVELKPTDALSLPITNLNLLEYRKKAHTTTGQKLYIIALSNS